MSLDQADVDWKPIDTSSARNTGRIRLVAALVTSLCALWLWAQVRQPWVWLALGAAALACLYWLHSFVRLENKNLEDSIGIGVRGFYRRNEGHSTFMAWNDIREITLDEELGAVRIEAHEGPPILLRDRYGNMGLEEIWAWIERYRSQCHNQAKRHGEI